jgi:hypothetical protein
MTLGDMTERKTGEHVNELDDHTLLDKPINVQLGRTFWSLCDVINR